MKATVEAFIKYMFVGSLLSARHWARHRMNITTLSALVRLRA